MRDDNNEVYVRSENVSVCVKPCLIFAYAWRVNEHPSMHVRMPVHACINVFKLRDKMCVNIMMNNF